MTTSEDNDKNILEVGLLHRTMVFFQKAEQLPSPALFLLQIAAAALLALLWHVLGASLHVSVVASLVLLLFSVADVALLRWLCRRHVSFGPVQAQTTVLLTSRAVVGVLIGLLVFLLDWTVVLGALIMAQASGTLLLWWGAALEPHRLALSHLELQLATLPPGSAPVRLLHISDIHLERWAERDEKLLALAREAKPDAILITGDYLNLSHNADKVAQQQLARLLTQLEAPYGVYATLGSPPVDLRQEIVPILEALPLQLLCDGWTTVRLGDGARLVLVGLDCTHYIDKDSASLARVADAAPDSAPRILLYHSPELMPYASKNDIDLYLCGHTHGGQVRLPLIGPLLTSSKLGRRYVMGHYRLGKTHLYVSRGVGLEGLSAPRVRLFAPPEITLVTLYPEDGEQ
ncbi:MAG TPA: metallophosphoesterase [Candidatus Binatia bacterium]|nr:metallophosphoesterase [Candidatus Binatia bacterium]